MYVAARVVIQEYHVMFTYRFGLCDHTPTRVVPNGPAKWAGPQGPSKQCGILWYVAVIYGMGTNTFVSWIILIQVIYHKRQRAATGIEG